MRLPKLTASLLYLSCSLLASRAIAQSPAPDSLDHIPGYASAIAAYHAWLKPEPALYRGSQYVDYRDLLSEGHPYFRDTHTKRGTVAYNGIHYDGVQLQYDLIKDALIIHDSLTFNRIILFSERVDSFSIGDSSFLRLSDTLSPGAPPPGFYQLLYQGRTSLLKKEKKTLQEDLSSGTIKLLVESHLSYYIQKDHRYYSVNTKNGLLTALPDKNKAVKDFIRKGHLDIKNDKENTLIKVLAWYDSQHP